MDEDDGRTEPSAAMIEHLARRLVERYGREATAEAAQIVALLTEDGNPGQAQVWVKVRDACRRMIAKPGEITRKP